MRLLGKVTLAAALLATSAARSEDTFAMADITLNGKEGLLAVTLLVTGGAPAQSANATTIKGTVVNLTDGQRTPIEVVVPGDLSQENALAGAAESGIRIAERHTETTKDANTAITKTVYSIEGESTGSIVVTDDPHPALPIVVIAAVVIVVQGTIDALACSDGDFKREIRPTWRPPFIRSTSECIRRQAN